MKNTHCVSNHVGPANTCRHIWESRKKRFLGIFIKTPCLSKVKAVNTHGECSLRNVSRERPHSLIFLFNKNILGIIMNKTL